MKKITLRYILIIFLLTVYNLSNTVIAQEDVLNKDISSDANNLMKKARKDRYFVGASAGIYAKNKTQWTGASGDMKKGKTNANKDMLTRTASISKPMTAIAILQLYEQGKIDLDTSIQIYFPEFPLKEKGAISIRNLLQHTSGITAYANNKEGFPSKHYHSLEDAVKVFASRPLAFEPGSQYLYTTYGYVVLGVIIERVSGLSYEDYMQEHIWSVANMPNTSLEIKRKSYSNKSKLYKKFWGIFIKSKKTDLSLKYPGGGIQSTASDLLNFGKAILENKLVKKKTLNLMIADPKIRKTGNGYGMGWFLYGKHPKNGLLIGHSGGQSGCASQLLIWPDKGVVAVLLANTQGGTTFSNFFSLAFNLGNLGLSI